MPTLREKFEASALRRLTLPEGRLPGEELGRFRNFLKVESHRLKLLHRAGGGGREVAAGRALMMDVLLARAAEGFLAHVRRGARAEPLALVAVGGYGRGELNPHSDLDVMFLHAGAARPGPVVTAFMDLMVPFLWDLGLKAGTVVRSLDDCVRQANADLQSKTALIEARLITGDATLFAQLGCVLEDRCVKGHEDAYLAARLADQRARQAKHGNSPLLLEPNLKNGCGGLRDLQSLLWMSWFKHRTRTLADLERNGQVTDGERRQLEAAYDFLLRARTELHYQEDRAADVLTRAVQPAVAQQLGYTDRAPARRLERFMGDYYRHARTIYLLTRTLERRLALKPAGLLPRLGRRLLRGGTETVDGLRVAAGELAPAHARIFREQPRRMMRAFLHAQQRGLPFSPELEQLLRRDVALVDRAFLADAHVHATFLEILGRRGAVSPVLRAMHELGFLGKYLPAFGALTCRVQHEFYHRYTADEHTLVCLGQLDAVWNQPDRHRRYHELLRQLERPHLLSLALLLHDAGKALDTGDHAEAGARLAERTGRRLGLTPGTVHTLATVVRHHLLMARVSQRRDLDDPVVVRQFAQQVGNAETLDLLTLHTLCDTLGTSESLWNDFKDTLLWTLRQRTLPVVTGGTEFIEREEVRRRKLETEVRRLLPRTFVEDEVAAHFEGLPRRYFEIHGAREIASDLALAHRFMWLQLGEGEEAEALRPVVAWHGERDRGYAELRVCTWNRRGLFAHIAGALAAAGLNILSARLFSRADGIILDTLYVNDAATGRVPSREARERFEECLVESFLKGRPLPQGRRPAPYPAPAGESLPTLVRVDHEASAVATVIDVETEDRVGLLHALATAFNALGLDIVLAKITTEKGGAFDTFYVTDAGGGKITDPARLREIEQRLRAVLAK
jgi:[protein-PII] uridylyltransferase